MREHERVAQNKQEDAKKKHRTTQQESEPSYDKFHTWYQGLTPVRETRSNLQQRQQTSISSRTALTETPFRPRMNEHAKILSNIPFSAQRHEFIMHLNNTYGYRYVMRLMESMNVQAKLTISNPNDVYEQEADRLADEVIRSINTPVQRQAPEEEEEELQASPMSSIQRQEEEEELQAQLTENEPLSVSNDLETRIDTARGAGQPLSDNVRVKMEGAFGANFKNVRVHTDSEADRLNKELNAKAFTTGQEIFFRENEYSPGSDNGQKLIAHELTHVVQQQTQGVVQRVLGHYHNAEVPNPQPGQLIPHDLELDIDIGDAGPGEIEEIGHGTGENQVFTNEIDSCIVLIARSGSTLWAVHLVEHDGNIWMGTIERSPNLCLQMRVEIATILGRGAEFYSTGEVAHWRELFPRFMAPYANYTFIGYSKYPQGARIYIDAMGQVRAAQRPPPH